MKKRSKKSSRNGNGNRVAAASRTIVEARKEHASRGSIDTRNNIASGDLRLLVDTYYAIQQHRIKAGNRIAALIRNGADPGEVKRKHEWIPDKLSEIESDLARLVAEEVAGVNVWQEWLSGVRGVGPMLAGCLLAWIGGPHYPTGRWHCAACGQKIWHEEHVREHSAPGHKVEEGASVNGIAAFATVSKLWAYAGLAVFDGRAQRRKRGEKANWNNRLKVACWKLADSFVKTRSPYRDIYDQAKEFYLGRGENLGHAEMMARRKMVKIFLANLWEKWRRLEGLPVTEPYIIGKGGHNRKITPEDMTAEAMNVLQPVILMRAAEQRESDAVLRAGRVVSTAITMRAAKGVKPA